MGRIKPPKPKQGPRVSATPSIQVSTDTLKPVFALHFNGDDYCISRCDKDHKAAFADKLHELSQQTWAQLTCSSRHGMGYEIIPQSELRPKVHLDITEEVNIIAFRFFGKAPLLGFRRGQVFHVLWLDPQFKAYKHG